MFCRAAGRYRSIMGILVTGGAGFIRATGERSSVAGGPAS